MVNNAPFLISANMAPRAVILKVGYYLEAVLWVLDVNKRWRRG